MRGAFMVVVSMLALAKAGAPSPESFGRTVDEVTPGLLRRFSVPGAAVALIRQGEVVWTRGYGVADVATGRPVTPETEFNVGSISKTPTAWAVMRLVEEGKVDLDRPVGSYLKRWHLPESPLGNEQVTVRRLLSHVSGLSAHDYHGWDPVTPQVPPEDSLAGKTGTGEVRVTARPGSSFAYSGANFLVLELLVEEVSGQAFQAYMASHIFQPLHMTHSQYGLPSRFQDVMAVPYDSLGKRLPVLRYNELAAAGLTTDLRDLAAFAASGLPGRTGEPVPGRGVLRPATVALMQSPAPNTRWAERDPYGPAPQYGLGHTVRPEQFEGHVGVGHGGTNNGWESLFQIVPATGDGIVIMTNSSNGSAVIASLLCAWRRWGGGPAVGCPRVEVRIPLLGAYTTTGVDEAVALYRRLHRDQPDGYDFSVTQLNSMGYQLMRSGDLPAALAIFNLNVEAFPSNWIPYDSLAEAYVKAGDKAKAITAYKRSIELNPANDNGREALKALGASPAP